MFILERAELGHSCCSQSVDAWHPGHKSGTHFFGHAPPCSHFVATTAEVSNPFGDRVDRMDDSTQPRVAASSFAVALPQPAISSAMKMASQDFLARGAEKLIRRLIANHIRLPCRGGGDWLITAKQWQVIAWGKQCSSQRAFRSPRTVSRNRKFPAAIWRRRRQIAAGKVCRMRIVLLGFHQPR